jgi:hypothetical protein
VARRIEKVVSDYSCNTHASTSTTGATHISAKPTGNEALATVLHMTLVGAERGPVVSDEALTHRTTLHL